MKIWISQLTVAAQGFYRQPGFAIADTAEVYRRRRNAAVICIASGEDRR